MHILYVMCDAEFRTRKIDFGSGEEKGHGHASEQMLVTGYRYTHL